MFISSSPLFRGIGYVLRRLSSLESSLPTARGFLLESLNQLLNSNSAVRRMAAAMVITEWANEPTVRI